MTEPSELRERIKKMLLSQVTLGTCAFVDGCHEHDELTEEILALIEPLQKTLEEWRDDAFAYRDRVEALRKENFNLKHSIKVVSFSGSLGDAAKEIDRLKSLLDEAKKVLEWYAKVRNSHQAKELIKRLEGV